MTELIIINIFFLCLKSESPAQVPQPSTGQSAKSLQGCVLLLTLCVSRLVAGSDAVCVEFLWLFSIVPMKSRIPSV